MPVSAVELTGKAMGCGNMCLNREAGNLYRHNSLSYSGNSFVHSLLLLFLYCNFTPSFINY
ncbi:MAG: hypothetical protein JNN00_09475 [Chitinophagaceae bacterium]|nr:hypothetical protein [Chitinophagaceae bacterium]